MYTRYVDEHNWEYVCLNNEKEFKYDVMKVFYSLEYRNVWFCFVYSEEEILTKNYMKSSCVKLKNKENGKIIYVRQEMSLCDTELLKFADRVEPFSTNSSIDLLRKHGQNVNRF